MMKAKILMLGTHISTMGGIASVIRDYLDTGLMERLNVEYIPTHRDGSKLSKVGFFLRQFPKAIAKFFTSDLVHIHTSHGWSFRRLSPLLFTARVLGCKTVLHVHGSQFDRYYAEANALERKIIRLGLRSAHAVIALSDDWERQLLSIEPRSEVVVIRNGVDCSKYRLSASRELHHPANVLFLGRLGERKGIYDILEAIKQVDRESFHFTLAGDGDVEEVRETVRQRGWEHCVTVPGWVNLESKTEMLRRADLYLLPSYHEGLPISILEAMAAALPVISTPVGGIAEAVTDGENGYLVPPGDAAAIAASITAAASDEAAWKQMSDASLHKAETLFDLHVAEEALTRLYQTLLD